VDSKKIADLLRGNLLPKAYCCSAERRPARELLRRRIYMMRERSALLAHISSAVQVYGQETLTTVEKRKSDRQDAIPKRFSNDLLKLSMEVDLALAEKLDEQIARMEQAIVKHTKLTASAEFNLLKSAPGIGKILALIILYEVDDIKRFPTVGDFCNYSRLAPNTTESAGKTVGKQGRKMGNQYLKWAFSQAVVLTKRGDSPLKKYIDRLTAKHGKAKANTILAHRLGRAVYFMLKRGQVFDMKLFLKGKVNMT
jgi:transposase